MQEAKYYNKLNDNDVQCLLCSHFCTIRKNEVGFCRARINKSGKLYSSVYGYPIALNIDPIEKKPLFHFLPGTNTYSLGTLGCNFRCKNCQNWDISQKENIELTTKNIPFMSPERIISEALANDCESISYTYNEPTIFTEYALDIMKLAHENEIKNVWVSNGFMSDKCLEAVLPYLDAINIDLKSMDDDFYKDNCGARLEPVLNNLKTIKREQIHLEVTTLIIPTLSDGLNMLAKIAEFISSELDSETPWHISKFSPQISWKLENLHETSESIIHSAYNLGKEAGLKYVYVGNIPGDQKENTYCPSCNELAIQRMGYNIKRLDNKGYCPQCGNCLDIIE